MPQVHLQTAIITKDIINYIGYHNIVEYKATVPKLIYPFNEYIN